MKLNELILIRNLALSPKEAGYKYANGFSDFIKSFKLDKFKEDNTKLIKIPTSI